MASANRVILLGNLTRDPEMKYVGQTPKVSFGIATNRKYKGQDGTQREDVCFVDCVAWAKTGEVINKYCNKGRPIYLEGRLSFDSWKAQDGSKRSKLYVTVDMMQLLGDGKQGQHQGGGNQQQQPQGGQGYHDPQNEMYNEEEPF